MPVLSSYYFNFLESSMKIVLPFYYKFKKKLERKFLKKLDYKPFYEAYKRYVISIDETIPENITFKPVKNPKVSIIIPVYNQYSFTMKCLRSIKENTKLENYEIILTDDCSTDETRNIENCVENVTVFHNSQNKGFLKNCNYAVERAKGEYIYLLNNDTQLLPLAIDKLVEILDSDETIGAAGSKLIYPDGKLQVAGSNISKNACIISIGHLENPLDEKYNEIKEVDYCCGASLMIRKELWQMLGGFDEYFAPAYFEETDLCMRIKKQGYKVIYQPLSEVVHYTSQTYSEKGLELLKINQKKFKKKWNL